MKSPGCACAFLTARISSHRMRLGLGVPVPQSPVNASDLLMWGVGPPQCRPCVSFPATGGRGQGRPGLASIQSGLRAGGGDMAGPAWQGHKCLEPWLVPLDLAATWAGVCAGVRQVKQGEFKTIQLQQQRLLRNMLGLLICMRLSACAGAHGSAVTSSDSVPSSPTRPVALAGSKLPF